jgi:hypothetical protein
MPLYRVYRMKESTRQHFRWAPHVSGKAAVKHRDYEEAGQIEAPSDYAAWAKTRDSGQPLEVGDLLEAGAADLRICKYIGFEAAEWVVPTPAPNSAETVAGAQPEAAAADSPAPQNAEEIGYTSADRHSGE